MDLVFQETTGAQVATLEGEVLEVLDTRFVFPAKTGTTRATLGRPKGHPVANGDHGDIGRHGDNFASVLVTTKEREAGLLLADERALLPGTNRRSTNLDQDLFRAKLWNGDVLDLHFANASNDGSFHGVHAGSFTSDSASSTEALLWTMAARAAIKDAGSGCCTTLRP